MVVVMMMVVVMIIVLFSHSYFRMLYSNEVSEIRMLVAENQSVVMEPTLEFWAFTLLGST